MTDERDYRETLLLPQTSFPMRASLPKREPELLAYWNKIDLYARQRACAHGREKFIFHDGPPYANGNLHIGHALNKILKDVVCRVQNMMGKDAPFVPGWDCHGLPIEWKIEEEYRSKGLDKDAISLVEFRATCRKFAAKWMEIQKAQFHALGILADWDKPYSTMSFDAEAVIVSEFLKFVMSGAVYRGSKPVMWSVVEKTALAEAEIEYEERVSPTIFVRFPITHMRNNAPLIDADIVIWTTTPWTIPANRAIAYARHLSYGIYDTPQGALVLADCLAQGIMAAADIEEYTRRGDINLAQIVACGHPLADAGYDFDVPVLIGDFVTDEVGTGLVHIAPGHGADDFDLAIAHDIAIPFTIDGDGVYLDDVPLFAGARVFCANGREGDANQRVSDALIQAGAIFARGKLRHQYPHSWRSKAPLIFRNTPQWFISLAHDNLRDKALSEIADIDFVPPHGRNRIAGMVDARPDWVVSRQRIWGVPLTIFVHKESGEILRDDEVNARIIQVIAAQGADAWYRTPAQEFLGQNYRSDDYEQIQDILDVWFDSGTTHAFVLEKREELGWPADLYLEGSDQHRGWFQSSLLEACGTRGQAPYRTVVTHGFVMDEQGRKMSKSAENALAPQKIIAQSGADILRLWVISTDYAEDLRIGHEIIKANTEAYRKMRNTLRFLLGNLDAPSQVDAIAYDALPALEKYMLHHLCELDTQIRHFYQSYDFRKAYSMIFNFMTLDLSAFYFDIRKDTLYCEARTSLVRQACQTVLNHLFDCLVRWLAPMLPFTMEEVWQARFEDARTRNDSIHLQQFIDVASSWRDDDLAAQWTKLRHIRRVVTGALEVARAAGQIGSSLEAAPEIYISEPTLFALAESVDMAELCITSQIKLHATSAPHNVADAVFTLEDIPHIQVVFAPAQGQKCRRSWKFSPDIGTIEGYPDLSPRDARAVQEYDTQARAL